MGILSIPNSSATKATRLAPDNIRPELRQYVLNMNDGTIIFSFTESVDSNTFNMSGVILSSSLSGAIQHTLRHEESILLVDGPNVKVKLSAADIEAITKTRDLAKSKETTYMSIGA